MTAAGLIVFDKSNKTLVILKKKFPYPGYTYNGRRNIEQFSIPRGKSRKNEQLEITAIREFIEETRFFPEKFSYLYETTYKLYWHDPIHKKWNYDIFFIEAQLNYKNSLSCNVENSINIPYFNFDSKCCKFSEYEKDEVKIMNIDEYINKMIKQLTIYDGDNNYFQFLHFLKSLMC